MALDEDDLDAFFDEVSEVEANVSTADETKINNDPNKGDGDATGAPFTTDEDGKLVNKKRQFPLDGSENDDHNESSSTKKPKASTTATDTMPPPRPRGVVVASASVKTNVVSTTRSPSSSSTTATTIPTSGYGSYASSFVPPPPPPPPAHAAPPPAAVLQSNALYSYAMSNPVAEPIGPVIPSNNTANGSATVSTNKSIVRTAAGKVWVDETLADWPDDDFRIFVGNLDPAVSDQQLFQHFASKYASVIRSRIVRDPKRTVRNNFNNNNIANDPNSNIIVPGGVSKGYGFVSFTNALECAKAIREMDQTWLGSRPIRVKRSHWKDRDYKEHKKKEIKSLKQRTKLGLL